MENCKSEREPKNGTPTTTILLYIVEGGLEFVKIPYFTWSVVHLLRSIYPWNYFANFGVKKLSYNSIKFQQKEYEGPWSLISEAA